MPLPLVGTLARVATGAGKAGATLAEGLGQVIRGGVTDGSMAIGNIVKSFPNSAIEVARSGISDIKNSANGIVNTVSNRGRKYIEDFSWNAPPSDLIGPIKPQNLDESTGERKTTTIKTKTPIPASQTQESDLSEYAKKSELSKIATTGNYNDLSNTPLAAVAVSGDYNDLQNKPDITPETTETKIIERTEDIPDAVTEGDSKQDEKNKLTKHLTTALEKVSSAFSALKGGLKDAKDDVSSGELGIYGLLGGLSGAYGGWSSIEDKYEKTATKSINQEKLNDDADTVYFDNKTIFDKDEDGEMTQGVQMANGAETFEQRADNLATERGYIYDEDSGGYINTTNDGKPSVITKEELIEEVKADAEKRYRERGGIEERNAQFKTPKEIKTKTSIKEDLNERINQNKARTANGTERDIETIALDNDYVYDEDSDSYINYKNYKNREKESIVSKYDSSKNVDVVIANKERLDNTDIAKNNISSLDTHTGENLSNTAMALEKNKEKPVTIISDSSAKVMNQSTTAYPAPISVKNDDNDVKYFNNRI